MSTRGGSRVTEESRVLTRNVSPIIQAGLVSLSAKKLPIHLLPVDVISMKSAGLIVQFLPPNDMVTLTLVLQAIRLNFP